LVAWLNRLVHTGLVVSSMYSTTADSRPESRSHCRAWISHSVLAAPRYFSSRVNRSSVAGM